MTLAMSDTLMRPFEGFDKACRQHGAATALEIGQARWTYGELQAWTLRLAALLSPMLGRHPHEQRVGVLASRSLTAYGGSLAVLASGATLVALIVHCVAIYLLRARAPVAFAAFLFVLLF